MTAADSGSTLTFARIARGLRRRLVTYVEGLGSMVPKMLYGNSAGLAQNVGPRRELQRLRAGYVDPERALGREPNKGRAERLRTDGHLRLPSLGDADLLARVRSQVNERLDDVGSCIVASNGATRFLPDPLGQIPQLRSLLTEEARRTISEYYGCALRIESVRVWRNYHVPGIDADSDDRFSNTFHHDNCPVTGLRAFVLLKDGVTRHTGAFRFHDKQTSSRLIRSLGYFHRNALPAWMRRRLADARTLRYFEGDTGDICICNTQECLHGASVPGPGTWRDILQFEVYPAPGHYRNDDALFGDVPPDVEVLRLRGS